METNGITPVMPVGGDGSFMWIFGLLILLGLFNGGGFGFNGNGNTNALSADMQRGFDAQNTMAQTRDILSAVTNGTAESIAASTQNAQNTINAIKDGNAYIIREFGNVETALAGLAGKQQECCCAQLRAIDGVNYNTTVQIQKVLDAIAGNRMADMQNQINQLQLQNAMTGVMRFPNAWTFNGGVFPPVTPAAGA